MNNEFNWSAYDKWLDPPDLHEIDPCEMCHEEGYHDEVLEWSKVCTQCESDLEDSIQSGEYCLDHNEWYCEQEHNCNV